MQGNFDTIHNDFVTSLHDTIVIILLDLKAHGAIGLLVLS